MSEIFSQSTEYQQLKEDWKLRKDELYDKLKKISLADADKKIAGQIRGIISEIRAIETVEESFVKYFEDKFEDKKE